MSDALSADAVNVLAKQSPEEQKRLYGAWEKQPLGKKETTEFLKKSTAEPEPREMPKDSVPKPSAPLANALRALRRYESKAKSTPSELDRKTLAEISETARKLLEGR